MYTGTVITKYWLTMLVKHDGGKHDGDLGYFSDHIVNASKKYYVFLSLLFKTMLSHSCVPSGLLLSTVTPIPKNKNKSLCNSNNYRGIALSNILGKLFDIILLKNNEELFNTSELQFGFKSNHSTHHCTFVLNEVVQYYVNNNSNVYVVLLDCSKAFDRVNYVKLFSLLLDTGQCPLVARFLINL